MAFAIAYFEMHSTYAVLYQLDVEMERGRLEAMCGAVLCCAAAHDFYCIMFNLLSAGWFYRIPLYPESRLPVSAVHFRLRLKHCEFNYLCLVLVVLDY
jgi:hypothetical protein